MTGKVPQHVRDAATKALEAEEWWDSCSDTAEVVEVVMGVVDEYVRQIQGDLDFLRRDQEPLERRYKAANAEAEALRTLVADIVDDAVPVLRSMPLNSWKPGDWRHRACRAVAGVRIGAEA